MSRASDWERAADAAVPKAVKKETEEALNAYRASAKLVTEHANIERAAAEGGYGRRQLFELIQNGADELVGSTGQVEVVLTDDALYCANEGNPVTPAGVGAILAAHLSPKKGVEIGRFGLGFKSVLGVTTSPQFFSRSGSFVFDPDWSRDQISTIVNDVDRVPVLRLARVVDPTEEAASDPVLSGLMDWATTVVKLPLNKAANWLTKDVETFPRQFLVFSPHVSHLRIRDRTAGRDRDIRLLDGEGGGKALVEGDVTERWKVFQHNVRPSRAADSDAGALQGRDEIPLIWAVPLDGPNARGRGRFWAFFPTEYETTLSGVVNAPWKLNEDRRSVLDGPFNRELVERAAALAVDNLEEIVDPEDPGSVLDKMPARGREAPNWADQLITDTINELAANSPVIPDQAGVLQLPMSVGLHPAGIPDEALKLWAAAPARPDDWAHWSVDNRERRARVERFLEAKGRKVASIETWMGEILDGDPVDASRTAVAVVAAIRAKTSDFDQQLNELEFVLTAKGELVPPNPKRLFLPGEHPVSDKINLIHAALASDEATRRQLQAIGIQVVDPGLELVSKIAAGGVDQWKDQDWEELWDLVRRAGPAKASPLLAELVFGAVCVRVESGNWVPLAEALLPGGICPAGDEENADVLIDVDWHSEELGAIRKLGAVQGPVTKGGSKSEPWFGNYRDEQMAALMTAIHAGVRDPARSFSDSITVRSRVRSWRSIASLTGLERDSPKSSCRWKRAWLHGTCVIGPLIVISRVRVPTLPCGAHDSSGASKRPSEYSQSKTAAPRRWRSGRSSCRSRSAPWPRRISSSYRASSAISWNPSGRRRSKLRGPSRKTAFEVRFTRRPPPHGRHRILWSARSGIRWRRSRPSPCS